MVLEGTIISFAEQARSNYLPLLLKKISKPENVKFLDEVTSIRKAAKDLKGIVNDAIYNILGVIIV